LRFANPESVGAPSFLPSFLLSVSTRRGSAFGVLKTNPCRFLAKILKGFCLMSFDWNRWITQPTTIHGLGVVAAGVGAALAQVSTGDAKTDAVVAVIAYLLVHLGINDNSVGEQAATALTTEAIAAARGGQSPAATKLIGQIGDVVAALQPPAPVLPPAGMPAAGDAH
jgi:hypothetical protein